MEGHGTVPTAYGIFSWDWYRNRFRNRFQTGIVSYTDGLTDQTVSPMRSSGAAAESRSKKQMLFATSSLIPLAHQYIRLFTNFIYSSTRKD
jgi:hypothetical protein